MRSPASTSATARRGHDDHAAPASAPSLLQPRRRAEHALLFPSPKSTLRLVGAILLEQDDEWAVADRRYFSAESMKQLAAPALSPSAQELLAAIG